MATLKEPKMYFCNTCKAKFNMIQFAKALDHIGHQVYIMESEDIIKEVGKQSKLRFGDES